MKELTLTADQKKALKEITDGCAIWKKHLLTGNAGTGKTTLLQEFVAFCARRGLQIVCSAPTHKAVSVIARKLHDSGLYVPCSTLHSLLQLKPNRNRDKKEFVRSRHAKPVDAQVVVIDECSMLDQSMMRHIENYLGGAFVLFVGDSAQLPPISEAASRSFDTMPHSHLNEIVRQAAGNPILAAAHAVRDSQAVKGMDWSGDGWMKAVHADGKGVYRPHKRDIEKWLRKAFINDKFNADPNHCRYLCHTNKKVAKINAQVRMMKYGQTTEPFSVGETVLMRAPIFLDEEQLIATNDEATILEIEPDTKHFYVKQRGELEGWTANVKAWRVMLKTAEGLEVETHIAQDSDEVQLMEDKIRSEARITGQRWDDFHEFKDGLAQMQSIFAQTVHTSQGMTITHAMVDVGDIKNHQSRNELEMKQLLYVALTRPTDTVSLVGV